MKHFLLAPVFGFILLTSLLFWGCKSKPVPPIEDPATKEFPAKDPSAELVYRGIEAENPDHLFLSFALEIVNPDSRRVKIESWRAEVNNQKAGTKNVGAGQGSKRSSLVLVSPTEAGGEGNDVSGLNLAVQNFLSVPLKLNIDMPALCAEGLAPFDEYNVRLFMELAFLSDSETDRDSPAMIEVSCLASFPGIQPPVFTITSIAVIKAELINTRFRVGMNFDNPNSFPVNLSSFAYELHGNGRLWASGAEKNVFTVPAKSSLNGEMYLLMNFIDMPRSLLDQIINLVDVNYRFAGEVLVATGIEYLPGFKTGFNLSGYSQVLDR